MRRIAPKTAEFSQSPLCLRILIRSTSIYVRKINNDSYFSLLNISPSPSGVHVAKPVEVGSYLRRQVVRDRNQISTECILSPDGSPGNVGLNFPLFR